MKFAVLFEDNDEFAQMRVQFRADHLQFLNDNSRLIEATGLFEDAVSAGPAGGTWIGHADDAGQVWSQVKSYPFFPARRRKPMRILEWTQVLANGNRQI